MVANAGGCDAYPYTDGINVESVPGGTKILATASVGVSFDDIDSINDSRQEAELSAKAAIVKFLTEEIKSDEVISKAVNETKSMSGESKQALRKETIQRVKVLQNSAKGLLRGVVKLGECYTKGREIRVSVGIKPETINQAGDLAGATNKSLNNQPTPQVGSASGSKAASPGNQSGLGEKRPLQGVDDYSQTDRLKAF
jgi:hypothetical protein